MVVGLLLLPHLLFGMHFHSNLDLVIPFLPNLRSGVPYIFCRGGKVRLIQLFDYLSAAP